MSTEVAEVLEKALAKMGPDGKMWWHNEHNYIGRECVLSAVYGTSPENQAALRLLEKLSGSRWLPAWNDEPGRTFAEVKALFEKAIAEQEAA